MIRVDGDKGPCAQAVEAFARTMAELGGDSHPGAVCRVRGGAVTVLAEPDVARDARLLAVPEAALPRVGAFPIRLAGDRIVLDGAAADAAPAESRAMAGMLEVFNAGERPAAWRRDSPWSALARDPALLDALAAGRGPEKQLHSLHTLFHAGRTDRLLKESFMGARRSYLEPREDRQGGPVLLPFVDLLNHHPRARQYRLSRDRADTPRRLWTHADRPLPDSAECFARYDLLDRLDTYLFYAFVDDAAPVMKSVPVEISLPDGVTITVRAEGGRPSRSRLPRNAERLRPFVPQIRAVERRHLEVQRLVLPGPEAPFALRRVLHLLLGSMLPGATQPWRAAAVQEAEAQVVRRNTSYYADLLRACQAARRAPPDDPPPGRPAALAAVDALARAQADHVAAYAHRMEIPL